MKRVTLGPYSRIGEHNREWNSQENAPLGTVRVIDGELYHAVNHTREHGPWGSLRVHTLWRPVRAKDLGGALTSELIMRTREFIANPGKEEDRVKVEATADTEQAQEQLRQLGHNIDVVERKINRVRERLEELGAIVFRHFIGRAHRRTSKAASAARRAQRKGS